MSTENTETTESEARSGEAPNERLVINPYERIGYWIEKKCPKCGAQMLGNKVGDEWCSFSECDYGCEDIYRELREMGL